jgi:hypothetical protein
MSHDEPGLDARLRRLFTGIDTDAKFVTRVMARIAAETPVIDGDRRRQIERDWALARRRLRRESWANLTTVAGIGAAAGALLWRFAPQIMQWTEAGGPKMLDPWLVTAVVAFAMVAGLWPLRARLTGAS